MADTIQIKRGVKAKLPVLPDGELGYCTDTGELYIGASGANKLVGKVAWATDISALQTSVNNINTSISTLNTTVAGKLTATAAANVSDVATEATTADVIASINTILANMKAAGLMKTS